MTNFSDIEKSKLDGSTLLLHFDVPFQDRTQIFIIYSQLSLKCTNLDIFLYKIYTFIHTHTHTF